VDVDDALNLIAPAIESSERGSKMFKWPTEPYEHKILALLYGAYKTQGAMDLTTKERSKLIKEIEKGIRSGIKSRRESRLPGKDDK
jgi:hypothetical protein